MALSPEAGWLPKLPLALGLFYLVGPIDLIPRRLHWYGFLDELFFLLFGLFVARVLTPEIPGPGLAPISLVRRVQFRLRILQADLGNFYLLQHRRESGFVITAKNSGSHWLKCMLNHAFSAEFGVPPPRFVTGPSADYLVGRGGMKRPFPDLPHIATSHTIPSVFFAWRHAFRIVPPRPVVVMVRDIESAICSNFLKWHWRYGGTLADYVRGDPTGRRHVADAWWYIHFFNRWGDVARAHPRRVLVVRYEALVAEPARWLMAVAAHLGIPLGAEALEAGLAFVDREKMRASQDREHGEVVIPEAERRASVHLSREDRAVLHAMLKSLLRHDFGYGYGGGRDAS